MIPSYFPTGQENYSMWHTHTHKSPHFPIGSFKKYLSRARHHWKTGDTAMNKTDKNSAFEKLKTLNIKFVFTYVLWHQSLSSFPTPHYLRTVFGICHSQISQPTKETSSNWEHAIFQTHSKHSHTNSLTTRYKPILLHLTEEETEALMCNVCSHIARQWWSWTQSQQSDPRACAPQVYSV